MSQLQDALAQRAAIVGLLNPAVADELIPFLLHFVRTAELNGTVSVHGLIALFRASLPPEVQELVSEADCNEALECLAWDEDNEVCLVDDPSQSGVLAVDLSRRDPMQAFLSVWEGRRAAIQAMQDEHDRRAIEVMIIVVRECLRGMQTSAQDGLSVDDIFRRLFPDNEKRASMYGSGIGSILSRTIEALVESGELAVDPEHGEGYYVWVPQG